MNTLALCIPAYNAEAFLPTLLQSAKDQYIPFDEILIYNDCSTDSTLSVAGKYGVTVITGDINSGCSFGKNKLAEATCCNWIHFHDADDELLPNFTTLAKQWMQQPDCPDIVLFNYKCVDHKTNQLLYVREFEQDALRKDPVAYAIKEQINPFCGLYNKQKFIEAGGYNTDPLVLFYEDSAFHIKMAIAGLSFSAEQEISIINYRVETSMSSQNQKKCALAQFYVFEQTYHQTHKQYAYQIASRLWPLSGILAVYNEWALAKKAVAICKDLGYRHAPEGNPAFKLLTQLNPFFALWLREKMIRLLKPQLRNV